MNQTPDTYNPMQPRNIPTGAPTTTPPPQPVEAILATHVQAVELDHNCKMLMKLILYTGKKDHMLSFKATMQISNMGDLQR